MLKVYAADQNRLRKVDVTEGHAPPADTIWFDLLRPSAEETRVVEAALQLELPSREEMQEIEVSSRLYEENGSYFMTATIISKADTENPESGAITFILAGNHLVTLRFTEPRPFATFPARAQRAGAYGTGHSILLGLLDAIIDRLADTLELTANRVDALSREIFERPDKQPSKSHDFQDVLRRIGRQGDLTSMARESLVNIARLLTFLGQATASAGAKAPKDLRGRLKTMSRDLNSLSDHASFLSNKINFLLDATLGMINIEQNAIIKIFSVAAVVFLPPTLIASIYGMNFDFIPELHWAVGYPLALVLMVLSALLPYLFFKRRGWL